MRNRSNKTAGAMHAIAIDFGGTKIQGCIVDSSGKISLSLRVPTGAAKGRKQVIDNVISVIENLRYHEDCFNKCIKGIGISMPGFVDEKGKVLFAGGTLGCLKGVNLRREIEQKAKFPVVIENDAKCFALAEALYGAGKGKRVVFGIIWGTGIGGGIVIDGKIFSGATRSAGEFGHMVVDANAKGNKCSCGNAGCLEMLASGKNIMRRYRESGGRMKNAGVREIYHSKEKAAKKAVADAVKYLGIGIAALADIINPDIFVVGGGVSKLPSPVYRRLEAAAKKHAIPSVRAGIRIRRHSISDSAGVLGAAALVLDSRI